MTFAALSTTDDVLEGVNLSGKRILVTGASAGLGLETVRALVAHGAHVIGAVRSLEKARIATKSIRERVGGQTDLDLIALDLASLASVRTGTDVLLTDGQPLDLIIANAGVMACPPGVTVDGFETQFGTNHLGHFALINRLTPLLNAGARVISLSSAGHRWADVDLEDPGFTGTPYVEFVAYARSKTANVLFAVEFDRRHKADGVRAASVHPGGIHTELDRHISPTIARQITTLVNADPSGPPPPFQWKTVAQGAATALWTGLVADADIVGGRYCEDCRIAQIDDREGVRSGVRSYALDPERASALWELSERMVTNAFKAFFA